jgi:hypothetical protein
LELIVVIIVWCLSLDISLIHKRLTDKAVHVLFESRNAIDNLCYRCAFGTCSICLVLIALNNCGRGPFNVGQEFL